MSIPLSFGRLVAGLMTLALAGMPLCAGLCKTCQGKAQTKDIGSCKRCGGMTTSGSYQICMECSERLQACDRCQAPLPPQAPAFKALSPGTFKYGRWTYTLKVSNAGTRSEGHHGRLEFAGKVLPEPTLKDFAHTPWGVMYWVGNPGTLFGGHGWMPNRKISAPEGRRVLPPARTAFSAALEVKVLAAGRGQTPEEPWIRKALMDMDAPAGVGVISEWEVLGPDANTLHDSRHFGQAVLTWSDSGAGGPLNVEISGTQFQAFELPGQIGTQKIVKHTVASSIASMDLYLAFRVVEPQETPSAQPKP